MKILRIVTPSPDQDDKFVKTQGTKLLCDDGQVHGVSSVVVTINPNDVVRARVELMCHFKEINGAEGRFFMNHPFEGKHLEVSSITFADGSTVDL